MQLLIHLLAFVGLFALVGGFVWAVLLALVREPGVNEPGYVHFKRCDGCDYYVPKFELISGLCPRCREELHQCNPE